MLFRSSPSHEAAAIMTRNRHAIVKDVVKQASSAAWSGKGLPDSEEAADKALRAMVQALLSDTDAPNIEEKAIVQSMAAFLDTRMCVPRDMGAMTAATIKNLAARLR